MLEISPGLFVGDGKCALSFSSLIEKDIRLIVVAARDSFEYFECPLVDDETDDVLLHVDDVFSRIHATISKGMRVLVHCVQGVSRSVALATGYIMKERALDFSTAYRLVCDSYPQANIADNFRSQLQSYGTIFGWDMSLNTQAHRLFRAKHRLSSTLTTDEEAMYRFLCRKCRECLFLDIHCIGSSHENYRIECLKWMSSQVDASNEGHLLCPRCSSKIGNFNWCGLMGVYEVPGFIITGSKVDRMPMTSSFKGDGFPQTKF